MSIYRQLLLALILSTAMALIGSLLASTLSTRSYLQEQLQMKNTDNAATLALSLSQKEVGPVEVELAVAALFDSGHYELISVVDPVGKLIVQRVAPPGLSEAPAWFVRCLPIAPAPGRALISNGWKQVGAITLMSHSKFAYGALWKSTLEMIAALVFAGILGGFLSTLILRRVKRPLDRVVEQARAITERRFITMPEPKVPELRQLASAMNSTVTRLKEMFEEEALRLETLRREINHDALTGLANRNYFMARLRAAVETEEAAVGSLMLVRVAHLAEVNQRLGRETTNALLVSIGKAIDRFAAQSQEGLAARLNGADFALLLPALESPRAIADALLAALVDEATVFLGDEPVAFIGIATYHYGIDIGALLTQVDTALAAAETDGINEVCVASAVSTDDAPQSAEQWGKLIKLAIDQRWTRLASFAVTDLAGRLLHRECPVRLKFSTDGEWMPAGRFIPIAERLGLTAQLDLAAVALGLQELASDPKLPGLAINLSIRSTQDEAFSRQLRAMLMAQPLAARRLWLEMSENGALAHFDGFRDFCREMSGTACQLGLEHFGRQISQIGRLHDLGLNYVKVDSSFIRDIQGNPGNQTFLKGLSGIAHKIGLLVLAEGVANQDELLALEDLGFDGATGPGIRQRP